MPDVETTVHERSTFQRWCLTAGKGVCVCIGGSACLAVVLTVAWTVALAVGIHRTADQHEGPHMLEQLRAAEKAYYAEHHHFFSAPACPPTALDLGKRRWKKDWECVQAFQAGGWAPPSTLRCRYEAVARPAADPPSHIDDFELTSECDLDGDGVHERYLASRRQHAEALPHP